MDGVFKWRPILVENPLSVGIIIFWLKDLFRSWFVRLLIGEFCSIDPFAFDCEYKMFVAADVVIKFEILWNPIPDVF